MVIMIIVVLAIVVLKTKVYLKISNGNTQTDELHNFLVPSEWFKYTFPFC